VRQQIASNHIAKEKPQDS